MTYKNKFDFKNIISYFHIFFFLNECPNSQNGFVTILIISDENINNGI